MPTFMVLTVKPQLSISGGQWSDEWATPARKASFIHYSPVTGPKARKRSARSAVDRTHRAITLDTLGADPATEGEIRANTPGPPRMR